jgi:hypothetical protein
MMAVTVNGDQAHESQARQLADYGNFIRQVYLTGGIPLVGVAVGAGLSYLSPANPIAMVLIVGGFLVWGVTTFVAYRRWKDLLDAQRDRERQHVSEMVRLSRELLTRERMNSEVMEDYTKVIIAATRSLLETPTFSVFERAIDESTAQSRAITVQTGTSRN